MQNEKNVANMSNNKKNKGNRMLKTTIKVTITNNDTYNLSGISSISTGSLRRAFERS